MVPNNRFSFLALAHPSLTCTSSKLSSPITGLSCEPWQDLRAFDRRHGSERAQLLQKFARNHETTKGRKDVRAELGVRFHCQYQPSKWLCLK